MIKIDKIDIYGWENAIRGMSNPMDSWNKSDSYPCEGLCEDGRCPNPIECESCVSYCIGPNDLNLMHALSKAGTDHRKFMRMIIVYMDITAPLYWWKEFDTYKVGTVANSCSTMHKIAEKKLSIWDFSWEHLIDEKDWWIEDEEGHKYTSPLTMLETTVNVLNVCRNKYFETKDKKYWWQMIQLLPSSYNQKRTIMLSYEVLANIYKSRKAHKLDEWVEFCKTIETLPYQELITGNE